jgi:hypothetical protein
MSNTIETNPAIPVFTNGERTYGVIRNKLIIGFLTEEREIGCYCFAPLITVGRLILSVEDLEGIALQVRNANALLTF